MATDLLSLKWNNHRTTFFHVLSKIRLKDSYCDVTLACDGKFYSLHKFVLATCSEYFEEIFERTQCKHPVIVLKDITFDDLEALLSYMYVGEVNVVQEKLAGLIKAAECLKIKGLAVPDEDPEINNENSTLNNSKRYQKTTDSPTAKRRRRRRSTISEEEDGPSKRISVMENQQQRDSNSTGNIRFRSPRPDPVSHNADKRRLSGSHNTKDNCSTASNNTDDSSREDPDTVIKLEPSDSVTVPQDSECYEMQDSVEGIQQQLLEVDDKSLNDIQNDDIDPSTAGSSHPKQEQQISNLWQEDIEGGNYSLDGMVEEHEEAHHSSVDQQMVQHCPTTSRTSKVDQLLSPAQGFDQHHCMQDTIFEDENLVASNMRPSPWYKGDSTSSDILTDIRSSLPLQFEESYGSGNATLQLFSTTAFNTASCDVASSSSYNPFINDLSSPRLRTNTSGENSNSNSLSPFQCSVCSYKTDLLGNLKKHYRTHTGERPYACPYCSHRTALPENLKRHMQVHTGEKKFSCSQCTLAFRRKHHLERHVTSVHKWQASPASDVNKNN